MYLEVFLVFLPPLVFPSMLLTSNMTPLLQISFQFCFSLVDIIYRRLKTQISLNFSMLMKLCARTALMTWKK